MAMAGETAWPLASMTSPRAMRSSQTCGAMPLKRCCRKSSRWGQGPAGKATQLGPTPSRVGGMKDSDPFKHQIPDAVAEPDAESPVTVIVDPLLVADPAFEDTLHVYVAL